MLGREVGHRHCSRTLHRPHNNNQRQLRCYHYFRRCLKCILLNDGSILDWSMKQRLRKTSTKLSLLRGSKDSTRSIGRCRSHSILGSVEEEAPTGSITEKPHLPCLVLRFDRTRQMQNQSAPTNGSWTSQVLRMRSHPVGSIARVRAETITSLLPTHGLVH